MFNFRSLKYLTATVVLGTLVSGSLATSSVSSPDETQNQITLSGTVRDFSDQHPDFERNPGDTSSDGTVFKYGDDQGITTDELGSDSKPVYAGGSYSTTNKNNFDQWYRNVSGVNQSQEFNITLKDNDNDGVYRYENTDFFPINEQLMGNEGRNKNFHFTYELHNRFTYQGGEVFNFSGDDDVWVYINGQKVIDIGGVHPRKDASVDLDEVASDIGLVVGESYDFNFFFAERHTTNSNFIIETTIELEKALIGGVDDTITTDEDTATTSNVLDNDINPNNDDLTVSKITINGTDYDTGEEVTLSSGALLTVESNGQTTYNPNNKFESFTEGSSNTDKFTYTLMDEEGNTDTAEVTMKINGVADAPVTTDNYYTTDEDTSIGMTVLENDTDADTAKEKLTITEINGVSVTNVNDKVTLDSDATVQLKLINQANRSTRGRHGLKYDPLPSTSIQLLNEGQTHKETFTYTVMDDTGETATGNVTIDVTGITDTIAD